jgi:pimeloyl-ACP methyl ester carboxylesterase
VQPVRAAVILVHGLWMGGWAMQGLRLLLSRRGYAATTLDYRSMAQGLDEHAHRLAARIAELRPVHLVGHSLGGLVILRYLRIYGEQRVGRVVLLGTPARACMAGLRLAHLTAGERLLGASRDIWRNLPDDYRPQCELGVIAGNRPWGLGRLVLRLPGTNDGVVRLEETEVAGMRDRIVLPLSHSGMLVSARVARQVAVFLDRGAFEHDVRVGSEHEGCSASEQESRAKSAHEGRSTIEQEGRGAFTRDGH